MTTIFEDLTDRFDELQADLTEAVEGLPVGALDWVPAPEMNSICALVVHLTGAQRYWIGDVALGEDSGRTRDEEFRAHGMTAQELLGCIGTIWDYTRQALTRIPPSDLQAERTPSPGERSFTVSWCLLHALEHSALHVGQVQSARRLWEESGSRSEPGPVG